MNKINLTKNFNGVLSRIEMKQIMAVGGQCCIFINGSWGGCDHDVSNA